MSPRARFTDSTPVAPDARKRLFTDHHVPEVGGMWIFRTCPNAVAVHTVLRQLVGLGCDGGDDVTVLGLQMYAYLTTPLPLPSLHLAVRCAILLLKKVFSIEKERAPW